MKTSLKLVVTVLAFAFLGMLLGPHAPLGAALWGAPPEGGAEPSEGQVAALMIVALVEAVGFGIGGAILLFGRGPLRALGAGAAQTTLAWLVLVWALMSWVPHSALHQTAGEDFAKLVGIEYAFHVTLILGASYLAWFLVGAARARGQAAARGAAASARAAPEA